MVGWTKSVSKVRGRQPTSGRAPRSRRSAKPTPSDTAASPSGLPLSPADRTDGGGSRRLPVAIRLPLRLLAFRALDVYAREAAPNPTLAMLDRLLADRAQWAGTVRRHVRRATSRDHEWPLGKILKAATPERGDEPRTVVRPTRPLKCRGAGQPCLGRLIDCPFVTRVRAVEPMRPTLMREPFHREGWVYEEKYDGFRMLAYREAQRVRQISRNGRDHTERFADIARAVAQLPPMILHRRGPK